MGQQKKVFAVSPSDGVPSEIEAKSRLLQKIPKKKDEKVGETNFSPTSPSQIHKPTHGEASNEEDILSSDIGGNTFLRNSQLNQETEDAYSGDFQIPNLQT